MFTFTFLPFLLMRVGIGLQQEQPELYDSLTKNLNPDEQQVVQAAVNQADIIAQQIAAVNQSNGHAVG
jgi:importin-7